MDNIVPLLFVVPANLSGQDFGRKVNRRCMILPECGIRL